MHCINVSHPEYKNLLYKTKENPTILKAKISLWMDRFTPDRFPTVEELEHIPTTKSQYHNQNPFKKLALYFNMNTAGFMPKNVDLAQIQREGKKLGLKPTKARNGSWYFKNQRGQFVNPHKMGQLTSNESENPNAVLREKLFEWAKIHGIEVTSMEELVERTGIFKEMDGAVAVADFLNKMIGIDFKAEKLDTMAEEISHFATLLLKNDISVKRAMEKVSETDLYNEVKEQYKNVYRNESDFRKETMDKLLAQQIIKEFKESEQENLKGIIPYLKAIFSKFKKWINSLKSTNAAEQIQQDLAPIAKSILSGEYAGEVETMVQEEANFQFFQKKEEEFNLEDLKGDTPEEKTQIAFLKKSISNIESRLKTLIIQNKQKKSQEQLQVELDAIKKETMAKKYELAVKKVVDLASDELEKIEKRLLKDRKEKTYDSFFLEASNNFVEMYQELFDDFFTDIEYFDLSEDKREEIRDLLNTNINKLSVVNSINKALTRKANAEVLDELNTNYLGEKIDPNFEPDILNKDAKIGEDIKKLRVLAGNFKNANSTVVNLVHKMVHNATIMVNRFKNQTAQELINLQQKAEAAGLRVRDLAEKDSKGNLTQYLIREYEWGKYYEAMTDMKKSLVKELGFDSYSEINEEALTSEQKKIKKKRWSDFYKQYAVREALPDGTFTNRPKNKNKDFERLMKNPDIKAYYDALIQKKIDALNKLPQHLREDKLVYQLPGIHSQLLEKVWNKQGSALNNFKSAIKEAVTRQSDDTQFGEQSNNVLQMKSVPIFYNTKFEDPNLVSTDLTRSITLYAEMAENFKQKGIVANKAENIKRQLGERTYIKKESPVPGVQSNEYAALKVLINSEVYGIKERDLTVTVPENKFTKKVKDITNIDVSGKILSMRKLSNIFQKYISTNNLALNIITSNAGAIKGTIDARIEDSAGDYTTIESKKWADKEFFKNLPLVFSQIGKKHQTNKMHLVFSYNNVVSLNSMLANANKNKLAKTALDGDSLFINYRASDYFVKGKVTLAIYDNHRLYNGKFLDKKQFIKIKEKENIDRKQINKEWKSLKTTLYDAYDVIEGKLQIKKEYENIVTEQLENSVAGKIEHLAHYVDGTLSEGDRGELARSILGGFLLMHRGWFVNMVDSRFQTKKINFLTEKEEQGHYPAFWEFVKAVYAKDKWLSFPEVYRDLDPGTKKGVTRTGMDMLYLVLVSFLASLTQLKADEDEDEYWTQFMALQMNRVYLEHTSGTIFGYRELIELIEKPVVGSNSFKEIVDIGKAINTDEIERGAYKGHSEMYKWWVKRSPIKSLYELQFPDEKNKFLKNLINNVIYNKMSEDDEEISDMSSYKRMSYLSEDPNLSTDQILLIDSYFK